MILKFLNQIFLFFNILQFFFLFFSSLILSTQLSPIFFLNFINCIVLCLLSFVVFTIISKVTPSLIFYHRFDAALIATGRAPFTKGLGLENVSKSRILSLWRMLCKIT